MRYFFLTLITSLFFYSPLFAGTFDKVVTIINNNGCALSACHDAENPAASLDLSGDKNSIYKALIDIVPQNKVAADKNNLLVKPGDPARSFLYRKINYDLHSDSKLTEGEFQPMPTGASMQKQDIELIRQWILFGAKNDDTDYVDADVLEEYYTLGGLDAIEAPEPPASGKGYQLQFGPIFLGPNEEVEYIYRYELQNPEEVEINRIDVAMNQQSHHFLFFKFDDGSEYDQATGLLPVDFFNNVAITNNTKMIAGWAYSRDFVLPEGTAFKWGENEVLKLNYHILNPSSTSILPAKLYVNIYTQPVGTAIMEMHSEFHLSVEEDRTVGISFPPGEKTHKWYMRNFDEARQNQPVHIWLLGSHTHKYGVDFDMYTYKSNTIGEQVYEGFYNADHTIPQNFYDYSEPPFKIFDDYLTLKENDALYIEGKYNNTSNETVRLGLTTKDEMFGMFVNYLVGDITKLPGYIMSAVEQSSIELGWSVYPNPAKEFIQVNLPENKQAYQLKLYNATGHLLEQTTTSLSSNQHLIKTNTYSSGVYMLQIQTGNFTDTKKLIIKR